MIAVVVHSSSRIKSDDFEIYRPEQAGSIKLVIMAPLAASDTEILSAVRGLLSDEELAAVIDFLEVCL